MSHSFYQSLSMTHCSSCI